MPGGTNGPSTGAPAFAIARDRRSAAGPVADGLAVAGPVSRGRPRDCSLGRFGGGFTFASLLDMLYERYYGTKGAVEKP